MDTKENKGRKVMAEMIKKKNAVMLADTRPALVGQMLVQLSVTNRHTFDEVIIFDTGICDNDKALMNAAMPCRFIPYESPLDQSFWEHERFQHFSMLMFARYEMFRLIREYSVIVWMDTDMVIQGTLQQLLELTSGYGFSILREDKQNKSADHEDRMRTNFFNPVPGYDMESYLYCTGLIVVRDSLEQKCDYTKWCYDKTMEWADNLNLPDQGVINALIQEFQFPVKALGQHGTYGCFPSVGRSCENAVLVHSWGSNKFWSDYYLNHKFPFWEECYQKWIDMGGSRLERSDLPEVSVVIPVYKPDLTYLKQCINSLLTQKRNSYEAYSNFEVILIAEPFEQEKIEALLQSFQDLRIRLFFNEKREGIAYSLNRGLELAQGKNIARMDDDDVAQEHRLWKQVTYLNEREEIEMCVSDYEYMGDMAEGRRIFEGEMSRAWSLLTCPFDHPTVMFRKSFFDKHDLRYDEKQKYAEDWELWLRAFEKGMTVGCIHEVLLYHRWHNGSAGQTEASSRRMKEIVQDNFRRLGVEIPEELVSVFCPWWGKVQNNEALVFLKESFAKALEENKRLGLYDQECLNRVFELRLAEAQTGVLPGLSWSAGKQEEEIAGELRDRMKKPGILRRILKRMLKPLYQPFRHRYEDRILELQTAVWRNEGHLMDCITKLDGIKELVVGSQGLQELIAKEQQNQGMQLQKCLLAEQKQQWMELQTYMDNKWIQIIENLCAVDSNICNTQEHLLQKAEQILDETHRHIDFLYRDILIALCRQKNFLPENQIILETDAPIAYESLDHLYPHGTIRDNTRHPRFVEKCEEIFTTKRNLAFLDLGCSGGGMVLEAALRGHISFGLEGSDSSKKEQRAEWRLLGDRLQTCDITKEFFLRKQDNVIQLFDIITAWEVLEHISESDLPQLFENIRRHLAPDGYFVGSIANWDDIDPDSGVNWHITLHSYEWWENIFKDYGFEIFTEKFDTADLARGGYNPPHCYEKPYPSVDKNQSFHIVARKRRK